MCGTSGLNGEPPTGLMEVSNQDPPGQRIILGGPYHLAKTPNPRTNTKSTLHSNNVRYHFSQAQVPGALCSRTKMDWHTLRPNSTATSPKGSSLEGINANSAPEKMNGGKVVNSGFE